ncbi:MAG: response regulator transcription factor [Verrucomicrobia bacterium]|jgi:DNA-binding NarL/FixJ family response regulator|nr:response regulator transcription factor [Verrucomicrobiota bacterium]
MRKLRAVLIEDETMFRQLILLTLGKVKDLQVVGEFGLGKPGLEYCLREKPDLLVVDLMLPDINGIEIAREVRKAVPETRILVITAHPSERLPAELMMLGVSGYVDKTEPIEYVLSAVETVRAGGMFFASRVRGKGGAGALLPSRPPLAVPLTEREQEIAKLVAAGQMSKEIAAKLNLSVRTVEKHRANIMEKVGVREVASLTRWCIQAGLIDS